MAEIILDKGTLEKLERNISAIIFADIIKNYRNNIAHDTPYPHVYRGTALQKQHIVATPSEHKIIFNAPSLKWIEFGTGARETYPPYSAIARWVRLKLNITRKKELRSVTWKMMRTIRKKGTKKYAPLHRAIEQTIEEISKLG